MLAGLYRRYEAYEYSLSLTDTDHSNYGSSVSDGAIWTATLQNKYSVDYTLEQVGVYLQHGYSTSSFGTTIYSEFAIPSLAISASVPYGFSSSLTFHDLDIYFNGSGQWYIKWSSIEWKVEGTTEYTGSGGTLWSIMAPVPSAIPIIGNPPIVSSTAGPIIGTLIQPGCDPGPRPEAWVDVGGDASCTAYGGFRVKDSDGWSELKVVLPEGGECLSHVVPFSSSQQIDNYWAYIVQDLVEGWQMAYPGHEDQRGHFRMNDGFEELIFRGELPKVPHRVRHIESHTPCFPEDSSPIYDEDETTDTNGYPIRPELLATLTDDPHVAEEPCTMRAMAPFEINDLHQKSGPPGDDTLSLTKTSLGENYIDSFSPTPAYTHPEWNSRINNTVLSPHWSYWPWFPPDTASSPIRWDLAGSDSDIDYWHQIRQQHVTHPTLSMLDDDTQRRVNCVSDLITQNGHTGVCQLIASLPCWLGLSRFSVDEQEYPTSFTPNEESADRYHFYDGETPSTGSVSDIAIELTTGYVIEFDMASFTAYPYMTPTLADRVTIPNISNTDSFLVFAIGTDGSEKLICSGPGTYRIPYGDAEKWASDAVQEFGAGYISDSFDPIAANNFSGGTFLFDTRTSSSLLLPAFSPEKIRIEVIKTNPGLPCFMAHPTFLMAPWADAKVFHETGRISTVLFKDGPCVRFGALSFYDYGLDTPLSEPLVSDLTLAPTIGDLWAWQNCFLLGKDALDDLATRMNAEFVNGEECTVVDHLWRDPDKQIVTISFIANSEIGPAMCYANSLRELPPTSTTPVRRRESSTGWKATGGFGMYSYELCEQKHPVIVPGTTPPHLVDTVDILEDADAPSGWTVRTHSIAVDNNEGCDYTLKWDNRDWFDVRPWRGWLSVLAPAPSLRNVRGVWHLMTKDGRFLNSWTNGSGAFAKWWHWILPRGTSGISTVASGAQYYQCRVSEDARHRIYAVVSSAVDDDFAVFRTTSDDGGKTWNELEEMDIPNGRYATNAHNNAGDMLEAAFVFDSGTDGPGTIQYLVRGGGDLTFAGPFTAKDSTGTPLSAADGSFQMSFAHDSAERVVLSFIVFGDTTPSNWFCTDFHSGGGTFTQFI